MKEYTRIKNKRVRSRHLSEEGANLIMALSSRMNNNRLSSNILPAAAGEAQTTNLDSTQPPIQIRTLPAVRRGGEVGNTEENLNYNLLVEKVKKLLSKP